MNFDRAQEILNADDNIEVLLNGTPVWIERLSPEDGTAKVRMLEKEETIMEVPVTQLEENRFMN